MLFKYLIGTVALAATVMGTPSQSTSLTSQHFRTTRFSSLQTSSYNKCLNKFTQVRQPVTTYCRAGQIDQVKLQLQNAYSPVAEISTNFQSCGDVEPTVFVDQSQQFINTLKGFEQVLVVINQYPKVLVGCNDVFVKFNTGFLGICRQFKSHGIDIQTKIKGCGLNFSLWQNAGYDFFSTGY